MNQLLDALVVYVA